MNSLHQLLELAEVEIRSPSPSPPWLAMRRGQTGKPHTRSKQHLLTEPTSKSFYVFSLLGSTKEKVDGDSVLPRQSTRTQKLHPIALSMEIPGMFFSNPKRARHQHAAEERNNHMTHQLWPGRSRALLPCSI
jgi:hypothetical protein